MGGIHYKLFIFNLKHRLHDFLAKVKLTACLKCARLFCTCPSHSAPVQIRARVLLAYKSQHVSDEKKNATSISENITVRRFYNEWFPALFQQSA